MQYGPKLGFMTNPVAFIMWSEIKVLSFNIHCVVKQVNAT